MEALEITVTILLALLGACAASFINAASIRYTEGESFIKGRSKCPRCEKPLRWFELIPVISWILILGKCRKCKEPVSPRYLLVELFGAFASATVSIWFGLSLMTPLAIVIIFILLAITLIDHSTMEIPNGLIIALIPLAIASFFIHPDVTLLERIIGVFTLSLPMVALAFIIPGAFGGGDYKLMAVCGFLLGWQGILLAFFLGVVTAGSIAIRMIFRKKVKKGAKMPFGPHLCFGIAASLLFGQEIITWYLGFFTF